MTTQSSVNETADVEPRRRALAYLGAIAAVGPLAMAVTTLAVPYSYSDSPAEWISKLAEAGAQTEIAFWGLLVWAFTAPVGAIVVGMVARRHRRRAGTAGMVLAFLGFSALGAGGYGYDGIALAATRAGLDTDAVVRLMAEVDRLQAPEIGAAVFIPLMGLGVILLGVALWGSPDVPRWVPPALVAAMPIVLVGGFAAMLVNAAGFAVLGAAFAAVGVAFARGRLGAAAGILERRVLAIVAAAGPIFMAGWALSVPSATTDSTAEGLPKLAAAQGQVEFSMWMLLAFALTAPVGAIVTGLVARRGSLRLGTVGLAATFLGFSALSAGGYAFLGGALASIRAGNPDATTELILDELESMSVAYGAAVFVPPMFLGVILLGIAAWRGRTVPRWAAMSLLAAFPVIIAGGMLSMQLNAVGWLLLAIGFGAAGAAYARSKG